MKDNRRRRLVVDRKLQGALLLHTTIYWFYLLFAVALIALCWIVFSEHPRTSADLFGQLWLNCGPLLVASVVLLPLVLLDCLRLSNRFAGPMLRFQRSVRELAQGDATRPVSLREGDFWSEFAADLNRVAERLGQLADEQPAAQPDASEEPARAASPPATQDEDRRPQAEVADAGPEEAADAPRDPDGEAAQPLPVSAASGPPSTADIYSFGEK